MALVNCSKHHDEIPSGLLPEENHRMKIFYNLPTLTTSSTCQKRIIKLPFMGIKRVLSYLSRGRIDRININCVPFVYHNYLAITETITLQ